MYVVDFSRRITENLPTTKIVVPEELTASKGNTKVHTMDSGY